MIRYASDVAMSIPALIRIGLLMTMPLWNSVCRHPAFGVSFVQPFGALSGFLYTGSPFASRSTACARGASAVRFMLE